MGTRPSYKKHEEAEVCLSEKLLLTERPSLGLWFDFNLAAYIIRTGLFPP